MNVNGLWTFTYGIGNQLYSMVATIHDGRITGGNNCYFYSGSVKFEGDTMDGDMAGQHYFGDLDAAIGGLSSITLRIKAQVREGKMVGTAVVPGIPMELKFQGQKRV